MPKTNIKEVQKEWIKEKDSNIEETKNIKDERELVKHAHGWTVIIPRITEQFLKKYSVDEFIEMVNKNKFNKKNMYIDSDTIVVNDQIIFSDVAFKEMEKCVFEGLMPSGFYYTGTICDQFSILPTTFNTDKYIDLNSEVLNNIIKDITMFIESEDLYKELSLMYKRGILLYGEPGNGKTMIISEIARRYGKDSRIIKITRPWDIGSLEKFKGMLEDKLTIFIFEELTEFTEDHVMDMLNFLDGQDSWNKSLVLATTNYPESLPSNLVDRPSRFDRIIHVGNPDSNTRKKYLETVLQRKIDDDIVKKTDGYSIAYLKEICIQHRLYNKSLIETIEMLDKRKKIITKFADKINETFFQ